MNAASAGRLRDALTATALFFATAAFTLWQNTRVAALWDVSYLLDSSFRIRLGQLPYRDFPFAHAPLIFLLHAAIIRIFGRIYYPHILCAALEAGAATLLTWRILLTLLNQKGATHRIGVVNPKEIVNLAQPESPYLPLDGSANRSWFLATLLASPLILLGIYCVYPHPIYDSDCILAVLFALHLLQRTGESPARNLLSGAACVLPLFFKQNIGLPFLIVTLFAVAAIATLRRVNHLTIAPQLWLFTGTATALAAALLALHATVGLHNYLHWTVAFAAQRRLPGLSLLLETYRQAALLWTIPAALVGITLLRSREPPHQSLGSSRCLHPPRRPIPLDYRCSRPHQRS